MSDYTLKKSSSVILEVIGLKVYYGHRRAVDSVSIKVKEGEIIGLLGHNGAGKTTFLKAIAGIVEQAEGTILLDGRHVEMLPVHERVKKGIVYVPEGMQVFPFMTVRENLEVAAYYSRDKIKAIMPEVFKIFPDLEKDSGKLATHLSGGQQRMLVLARALMTKARVLLLDDPFLGLTPKLTSHLVSAIRNIALQGHGILLAGQHVKTIMKLANRINLLVCGKLSLSGSPDEVGNHPILQKTLFGSEFTSLDLKEF